MKKGLSMVLMSLALFLFGSNTFAANEAVAEWGTETVKVGDFYYHLDKTNVAALVTYGGEEGAGTEEYAGDIVIPESIEYEGTTYKVTAIGDGAFQNCAFLTSVVIPEGVKEIWNWTFADCKSLASVEIPSTVNVLGDYAFGYCSSLTGVKIPDGIDVIRWGVFAECSSIEEITIPESVTYISFNAFGRCSSLKSITIPSNVNTIEYSAFAYCSELKEVIFEDSENACSMNVGFELDYSFDSCPIEKLYVGRELVDFKYWNHDSLKELTLGSGLKKWSTNYVGKNIERVNSNIEDPTQLVPAFDAAVYENATLYVPEGTVDSYKAAEGWSQFKNVKFFGQKTKAQVGDFYYLIDEEKGCAMVTYGGEEGAGTEEYAGDIVIPESIEYNGVTYPVTAIGDGAFQNCAFLTSVVIPEGVKEIWNWTFADCKSLVSVEIPSTVNVLGDYAFGYCSSLTDVKIPEGIDVIRWGVFAECSSLEEITIPASVTYISFNAFGRCKSLKSITIPSNVNTIEYQAFAYCENLKEVIFEDSDNKCIMNTGFSLDYTFDSCPIENLYIGRELVDFKYWNHDSLTKLSIGSGVTTWSEDYVGTNIKEVNSFIEDPTQLVPTFAAKVYSDATLYVPSGKVEAYKAADGWSQFANIVEMSSTGVDAIENNAGVTEAFLLNGAKAKLSDKGVVIVKDSKGNVKKIVRK